MPELRTPQGHSIQLPPGPLGVGEDLRNEVPIAQGLGLAPLHFRLQPWESGHFLEDAASGRGTLVNGRPVSWRPLQHGDVITAGDLQVIYLKDGEPVPAFPSEEPPAPATEAPAKSSAQAPTERPMPGRVQRVATPQETAPAEARRPESPPPAPPSWLPADLKPEAGTPSGPMAEPVRHIASLPDPALANQTRKKPAQVTPPQEVPPLFTTPLPGASAARSTAPAESATRRPTPRAVTTRQPAAAPPSIFDRSNHPQPGTAPRGRAPLLRGIAIVGLLAVAATALSWPLWGQILSPGSAPHLKGAGQDPAATAPAPTTPVAAPSPAVPSPQTPREPPAGEATDVNPPPIAPPIPAEELPPGPASAAPAPLPVEVEIRKALPPPGQP